VENGVTEQGKGWLIEPMPEPVIPAQRRKMTRDEIRAAMGRCRIEVKGSWEELRALTREP